MEEMKMIKNARQLKSQSGFSLVELMVVVAIIGILATVAIPSVSKYMAKARQSEIKSNLASVYSAQKAFFVEYNGYASHFNVIGHAPDGSLRYDYGFDTATTVAQYAGMGYNVTAATLALPNYIITAGAGCTNTIAQMNAGNVTSAAGVKCTMLKESQLGGVALAGSLGAPAITAITYAGDRNFIAGGQAIMNPNAPANIDVWTINSNKVLDNAVNGI